MTTTLARVGTAIISALLLLTWALSHRYGGLFHDALLYTLQSAARLHPASLSHDVFLAFGSQDRFTIFSPLYAAASRMVGIESAAMALTLVSQVALTAGAWFVARSMMPARLALLGLMVFIAIPGAYGPERIFTCFEPFLTPRMAAEALVLLSLAAALHERRALSGGLLLGAIALHPLMAGAGLATLLSYRRAPWLLPAAIIKFALLVAVFGALQRFDPQWLAIIKARSPYLFLAHWDWDDTTRCILTLVTLGLGGIYLVEARARALCWSVVATALIGLLMTAVLCDFFQITLFTQLQPWRWTWLATAVAALLLPAVLKACWSSATGGRITALCLSAAWLFASGAYCMVACLGAVAAAAGSARLKGSELRLLTAGAAGLFALAIIYRITTNLTLGDAYDLEPTLPLWLGRAVSFVRDGSVPVGLVAMVHWVSAHQQRALRLRAPVLAGVAVATALGLYIVAQPTADAWLQREYSEKTIARFAPWRQLLPSGAQVFWPDSTAAAWLLLDRPNYLSVSQTSAIVFSRAAAIEMQRRARALDPPLDQRVFLEWNSSNGNMNLGREQLRQICNTHAFDFFITAKDLQLPEVARLARTPGDLHHVTRLYDCKAQHAEAQLE